MRRWLIIKGRFPSLVLILFSSLTAIASSELLAATTQHEAADLEKFLGDRVIDKHWPDYPWLARGYHFDGEGKYLLKINPETGDVTSVSIVKSSAHKILDDAAIFSLRRWRFRPHTLRQIMIPVNFSLRGVPVDKAQRLATWCVEPDWPVTWHHGTAVYRFIVDYESGRVNDVQIIKSSGLPKFDEAVVTAYRQWRFPPHKVRAIDETIVVRPSYL
jgi:TonB family protein